MKLLFPALLIFFVSASVFPEKLVWEKNLKTTLQKAAKEDKLIMVDVYTEWCGYCTKLDEETYTDAAVIKLSRKFYCLKINPEKDEKARLDLIKGLAISGYPAIFFMNAKKELYGRIDGYLDGPSFIKKMEVVLQNKTVLPGLRQGHNKGNLDSTVSLIDALLATGLTGDAVSLIRKLKDDGKLPQRPGFYLVLGYNCVDSQDWANANASFKAVAEMLNDGSDSYYEGYLMSLYTLYMKGDKDAATKQIKDNIDKKDSHSAQFQDLLDYLVNNVN
jgi:thioredoxin-related protein